jgi:hypothetical protein
MVAFYTAMRNRHRNGAGGTCRICHRHRCHEYRYATAQLILCTGPVRQQA